MTGSNTAKEKLMTKVLQEISLAKHYRYRNEPLLEEYVSGDWDLPQSLKDAHYRKADKIRVGYIVATCSPATRAHVELAEQAIRDLGLTHVFFVIWPFHYIAGFHAAPLNAWIEREKHIDEEHRENILRLSLEEAGTPASVFGEAAALYRASSENFSASDRDSFFWTGTWFVLRVLQRQVIASMGIAPSDISFYFICGEDQFNPNIQSAVDNGATEKVWKDYSIAQHLAIHNVYAVPRGGLHDTIEHFETHDSRLDHKVMIGAQLTNSSMSATKIRLGLADPLESFCYPRAAAYIRQNRFWGYGNARSGAVRIPPAETYEPLRKFIRASALVESNLHSEDEDRFVWADRTMERPGDPYLILFRSQEKPHFQRYYVS
jgi:nicotinic acid mononucleotide adenylyltransferase